MPMEEFEKSIEYISYPVFNVKEYFYDELKSKYNRLTINKKELAYELTLSQKSISNRISLGTFPIRSVRIKKLNRPSVFFMIEDVADYLASQVYTTTLYM